jgi:hypothetical protein
MKRLAIFLDWLATGSTYNNLHAKYDVSKGLISELINTYVVHFRDTTVRDLIKLPAGEQLQEVMKDFELLCHLPGVCGALDGTFVEIGKPTEHGNMFWCYKHKYAITVLAVVNGRGQFCWVDAGKHGSAGDAAVWAASRLRQRLFAGEVYKADPILVDGYPVLPYLVADSAFALHPRVMKCYWADSLSMRQYCLNYCLIRTRRVVEQAFGRLKGRFRVLTVGCKNFNDPVFVEKVALVCCALHNFLEPLCEWDPAWDLHLPLHDEPTDNATDAGGGNAVAVQSALASYAQSKIGHLIPTP